MPAEEKTPLRFAGMVARAFINSKLTPLFIAGALLAGAFAILMTPREEEPQIVVPMLDVFVRMPGATPAEVQQRATIPMERLLREVPGVEYVYSISQPGMSMLVVRFYVGTKEEDAIIKVYNKLYSNFDRIPQGVSQPLIKVRSIDDVPIMALTAVGRALQQLPASPDRRRTGTAAQADRRRFGNEDHRRAAPAGAGGARLATAGGLRDDRWGCYRATGAGQRTQLIRKLCPG